MESTYRVATRTDVGRRRQRNEDYLSVNETSHGLLVVVCDGMGGHVGGERASRLAVQQFIDAFQNGQGDARMLFATAVTKANEAVFGESTSHAEYSGMGTTLVAALVRDGRAMVVNVGDSRAYRWHAGRLERLTSDHSVVEELVASGKITAEQARIHPQRNLITRALGTTPAVEGDFYHTDLGQGDALLLASDGLHGMIADEEIGRILRNHPGPDAACDALVSAALEAGGDDNVTVALVRFGDDAASAAGPTTDPGASQSSAQARTVRRTGSAWLWLVLAVVAAAAAWLLFARPWERADELAPQNPSSITVDTSLSEIDSILIDSTTQATPFDQLRSDSAVRGAMPIDTLTSPDTTRPRDTMPRGDAVTGRR
jgi:serine/threonine protein phosphatase PrpC